MWTHCCQCRIRLNLCFLRPTRDHNPNGKSIGSAVFAQLTAECSRVHWCHLANTIEVMHIGVTWRIRLNLRFLRLIRLRNSNGITIGSAVFAQVTPDCSYTLQWGAPFPSKLPLPMGDLDAHTWSFGPPKSSTQTASPSV